MRFKRLLKALGLWYENVAEHKHKCQIHNPYHTWSFSDLSRSIKERGIKLPQNRNKRRGKKCKKKRTPKSLRKALVKADKSCNFRLMDLPTELRQLVYEMAIPNSISQSEYEIGAKVEKMPALLHTSSQVRREASPIFYRNNYIKLRLTSPCESRPIYKCRDRFEHIMGRNPSIWLPNIDSFQVESLRFVSFKFFWDCSKRRINMDLRSNDASHWTVLVCFFKLCTHSHEQLTLGQWKKRFESEGKSDMAQRVLELIIEGNDMIRGFKEICAWETRRQLTIPALQTLSMNMAVFLSKVPCFDGGRW
ncbi:hypothetical protein D6D12_10278 [Aureobasidium pullulans]|uniref:F-box domain-containing protein n=1 Tax=Aureobasidium pullulans TaxID=5580 RepID=A0AB74JG39_AURPU|nr:hypothetical protein D6D12_10278 [Aureobasidium pullulans]THX65091.1 hypothetical protein D6D11_00710 [Aureobasidium pullulans]